MSLKLSIGTENETAQTGLKDAENGNLAVRQLLHKLLQLSLMRREVQSEGTKGGSF